MSNPDFAVHRARWLAELAEALDQARDIAKRLAIEEGRLEAVELSARIDCLRTEVQGIRLMRIPAAAQDFGPEWTKDVPWKLSA
jgi:putative heme degradation protein